VILTLIIGSNGSPLDAEKNDQGHSRMPYLGRMPGGIKTRACK
jgi:hypothetical protein